MGMRKYDGYCAEGLYDFYMEKELEGLPLEAIPEINGYLKQYRLDYTMFLELTNGKIVSEEDYDNQEQIRKFILYKIHQDIKSPDIGRVLGGIYEYIENHLVQLETTEYIEWRYGDVI